MLNKKNIRLHLLSLLILCLGFVLTRYILFDFHGMKAFPVWLLWTGIVLLIVSFFLKGRLTPIFTSFAYSIGFAAGVIFQQNGVDAGGGTTNNLWVIWAIVFVCVTLVGIAGDKLLSK